MVAIASRLQALHSCALNLSDVEDFLGLFTLYGQGLGGRIVQQKHNTPALMQQFFFQFPQS